MKKKGKILEIKPVEEIGKNGFKKRVLILETDRESEYPQKIPFEFVNANTDKLDDFVEGEDVEVTFAIKGRDYNSQDGEKKYFISLQAWSIVAY